MLFVISFCDSCLTIEILWKACFDFARVVTSVIDHDIVPHENMIRSIAAILSEDNEGPFLFRYVLWLQIPHLVKSCC